MHCTKILCTRQRFVFGAQCVENELWEHCCLKRQLLPKITQILWLNSFLCWKGMLFSARWIESPYRENNSFLAGLFRWSHCQAWNLATFPDLTPPDLFLWGYTAMTQEAWRTTTITLGTAGCCRHWTKALQKDAKKQCENGECLSSRKCETSSASAVLTVYHILGVFEKIKINGSQYCVGFYTVHSL